MTVAAPHSETFTRFLAQLRATGRDRLEGFDRSDFAGLTPEERDAARGLLRDALLAGDALAAPALALLDGVAARPVLDAALPAYPAASEWRAILLGELWRLTRDPTYSGELAALAADTANPNALMRQTALVQLENSPASPTVVAALWHVVGADPTPTVRYLAVGQLLYAARLIADVHQDQYPRMDIVRVLIDGDAPPSAEAVQRFRELIDAR